MLRIRGYNHDVAASSHDPQIRAQAVEWQRADPSAYSDVIFVSGPVIGGSASLRALLGRFDRCRSIAVGVSILPVSSPDRWLPFDYCFASDGLTEHFADVACAAPLPTVAHTPGSNLRLGLSLRGPQREYGLNACLAERAAELVGVVLEALAPEVVEIDTRLDRSTMAADAIDAAFASVDLVITTRLHGALLALRHGVPVLALDQIAGGGKVQASLRQLGWRQVFRVADCSAQDAVRSSRELLELAGRRAARAAGRRARQGAFSTLRALWRCLAQDGAFS